MSAPDERALDELRARADGAAPIAAEGPHPTDAELARIAADDESPELDVALRHLASCAACRARLVARDEVVTEAALAEPRAPRPLPRWSRVAATAAILAAAAAAFVWLRPSARGPTYALSWVAVEASARGDDAGPAPSTLRKDAMLRLVLRPEREGAAPEAALFARIGAGWVSVPSTVVRATNGAVRVEVLRAALPAQEGQASIEVRVLLRHGPLGGISATDPPGDVQVLTAVIPLGP